MGHITITGHRRPPHGAHHGHTIAAAFWIIVGMVTVIVLGDTLALLALALGIVTTGWWIYREAEHRVKSNRARRHVRPRLPASGGADDREQLIEGSGLRPRVKM